MMKSTIESRVSGTVLQQDIFISLKGRAFRVAPPTIATLVLVSERIANFPKLTLNTRTIISDALKTAKDCAIIGEIIAILILGAKTVRKDMDVSRGRFNPLRLFRRNRTERLARFIMEELSPDDVKQLLLAILDKMEVASFFAITTFLNEINLTKPTQTPGKVEKTQTAATASGE